MLPFCRIQHKSTGALSIHSLFLLLSFRSTHEVLHSFYLAPRVNNVGGQTNTKGREEKYGTQHLSWC